jgi:hypothetical protein
VCLCVCEFVCVYACVCVSVYVCLCVCVCVFVSEGHMHVARHVVCREPGVLYLQVGWCRLFPREFCLGLKPSA